ncbi:MAG: acetolactate synthase 3 regulatory subunit, acetolactate synthase I/III small subunit [Candidatus Gottesmanbacteria bacterium GW2011_GWA2_43_14]|uniref:Acetolactate synthase small subunit n=1 Tax=Candidatus Gottesmanbacteria bacterium GW2011_GWA2_43_14 TaxID=1618443 RepID=A0A0G1FM85_9BACT|nr:MAG: acetolactate synthase 3 regulatory subunit, acetolactate synthase I/III small subunit [Candidatus Gottesmanbacteria bacterium GW2011_GWA2_43_14]
MTRQLSNIIIWAENKTGVFFRILWLFRRKQFNIESATVGHSETPGITRFTITVAGNENQIANMVKQITKLVNVIKAETVATDMLVYRELALMKVAVKNSREKGDILRVIEHFRGRAINMAKNTVTIEVTGDENKIDAFYENMKDFAVLEFVRTGRTALFK